MRGTARAVLWGVVMGLSSGAGARQCDPAWIAGTGHAGAGDLIYCSTLWDPDGAGPRDRVVVIGGIFQYAGTGNAVRVAAYDPATSEWSTFGSGMSSDVRVLAVLPDGSLVAGGNFTLAGGVPAAHVARWTGSAWVQLGAGLNGTVYALHVHNGELYAGGFFSMSGTRAMRGVARWDGSAWQALGNGINDTVRTMVTSDAGELVVGGVFTMAGTVPVNNVARYSGGAWSAMGSGAPLSAVYTLRPAPGGGIAAGGLGFSTSSSVYRWNGTAWVVMGLAFNSSVFALGSLPNGELVAGGPFTQTGSQFASFAARWTGSAWVQLGRGAEDYVYCLGTTPTGELLGSSRKTINGVVLGARLDRYDGQAFVPLAPGFNLDVYTMTAGSNGDVYAGGAFTSAGMSNAGRVARWDGTEWRALGDGVSYSTNPSFAAVNSVLELANGDVVVGGFFNQAGGVPAASIARWNGKTWQPLGAGLGAAALCLAKLANGDIIAGGSFATAGGASASRIARWDGSAWHPLGSGIDPGNFYQVQSLSVMPNGDIIAGGNFPTAGGVSATGVARWDGTSWSPLGTGLERAGGNAAAFAQVLLPNGDLVVGGNFTGAGGVPASNIARYDGAAWHAMGDGFNGSVQELALHPSGDVIAVGSFTMSGTTALSRVARWTGSAWTALGTGVDNSAGAVLVTPDGDVLVGGGFRSAGGAPSSYFARYRTAMPRPVIEEGPVPVRTCRGGNATFSVRVTGDVTYQWRRDGDALDTTENPSAASATLVLSGVGPGDAGAYDCVVSGECASESSGPATLTVCIADTTCDGVVNSQDFFEFLVRFFALDPRADINADGVVSSQDFFDFLGAFFLGC